MWWNFGHEVATIPSESREGLRAFFFDGEARHISEFRIPCVAGFLCRIPRVNIHPHSNGDVSAL